jgi:hypothetical protein
MLYYSGFVLYDEDILKRRKAKEEPKKAQKKPKERDICVYGRFA